MFGYKKSDTTNQDLMQSDSTPENVPSPVNKPVIGYKWFGKGWTNRGFKYSTTEVNIHHGKPVEVCYAGFHFCDSVRDALSYAGDGEIYHLAKVEASGVINTENDKSVTDHLKIIEEIPLETDQVVDYLLSLGHMVSLSRLDYSKLSSISHSKLDKLGFIVSDPKSYSAASAVIARIEAQKELSKEFMRSSSFSNIISLINHSAKQGSSSVYFSEDEYELPSTKVLYLVFEENLGFKVDLDYTFRNRPQVTISF